VKEAPNKNHTDWKVPIDEFKLNCFGFVHAVNDLKIYITQGLDRFEDGVNG
jgi:hypothetical protein